MIKIIKKDSKVSLEFVVNIPEMGNRYYTFEWNCNSPEYAGLLAKAMRNGLWSKIGQVRQEAYENGWKDAKGKRAPKATYHSGFLAD